MSDRKQASRGLGRGLSALMAEVAPQPEDTATPERPREQRLPVEKLVPNPDQPRRARPSRALPRRA
jgi:ParB family chromosome partitioning protein